MSKDHTRAQRPRSRATTGAGTLEDPLPDIEVPLLDALLPDSEVPLLDALLPDSAVRLPEIGDTPACLRPIPDKV